MEQKDGKEVLIVENAVHNVKKNIGKQENTKFGILSVFNIEKKRIDIRQLLIILAIFTIIIVAVSTKDTNMTGNVIRSCDVKIQSPASEDNYKHAKPLIERYETAIDKYSNKWGVDKNLVKAIITQESGGKPDVVVDAGKGRRAMGLMQVVDTNYQFDKCKVPCSLNKKDDLLDPEKNICCGAKILKDKYLSSKIYSCTGKTYENWEAALRGYNGWGCKGADIDYVEKVMQYYEAYSKCKGTITSTTTMSTKTEHIVYSVKPSFKANAKYDIDEYKEIVNNMKLILDACTNSDLEVDDCIDLELSKIKSKLEYTRGGCDIGAKKVFYDIYQTFTDCKNSIDDDCTCEFQFSFDKEKNLKELLTTDFDITIKDGTINLGTLSEDIDAPDSNIKVMFLDDGTYDGIVIDKTKKPGIKLYKHNNKITLEDVPKKQSCMQSKQYFRFCVESKNKIYAYDENDKQTRLRPIIYKFALFFNDPPIPAITDFRTVDNPDAENSVIIIFKKTKATDLARYDIVSAQDSTVLARLDELDKAQPLVLGSDYDDKGNILHKLIPKKLYNMNDYFAYVLVLDDAKAKDIAVLPIDKNGNKVTDIPDDAIKTALSIDDLAPKHIDFSLEKDSDGVLITWSEPKQNTDNSKILETEFRYSVYYSTQDFSSLSKATLFQHLGDVHAIGFLQSQGTYYITVVAYDEKGNYDKELIVKSIKI